MTAPKQLFGLLGTGNSVPGPYPHALATWHARTAFVLATILQLSALRYVGTGRIAGTVKVVDVVAPYRRVRLYDKVSGTLARQTLSDASGLYAFEQIDKLRTYYVTAEDAPGGYNATIEDFVTPA